MSIGGIVELTLYFLYPYRHVFECWDVRDDAIGIAVAVLVVQLAGRVNMTVRSRS